jgi:ABC-type transporter Mla subunit MlaD
MENNPSLEYAQLKTDIALLRGDIGNLDSLVSRLDVAIDKFSVFSSDINRLLAVHDNKIENHTRLIEQLADASDRRRTEFEKRHQEIIDKILQIKEDTRESIHASKAEITKKFDDEMDDIKEDIDALNQKVDAIEKWRWLVMGGAVIAGWIISKLSWIISLM